MNEQKNSPVETGQIKILSTNNISYREKIMQEAKYYAEHELNIIPLSSVTSNGCTCYRGRECKAMGKHPMIKDWINNATTDLNIIKQWLERFHQCNIGIATGEKSGILVLDIDVKYGGEKNLSQLEQTLGKLPKTPTVITGSGGVHYYFKYNKDFKIRNQVSKIGDGIDIRSDGGLIVAPPSIHHSGTAYKWENGLKLGEIELAELPCNWVEFISSHSVTVSQAHQELKEKIDEGSRNSVLFKLACSLRVRGLNEDEILCTVNEVNDNRCNPPLDEEEIINIVKSSVKYQKGNLCNMEDKTKAKNIISAVDLLKIEMPDINWIAENLISTGLHIIAGKPKVGKSWLVLMLGIKVAVGSKLWNKYDIKKGDVLYLALEDNTRRLKSRLEMILVSERPPKDLHFCTEWNDVNNGGINEMEKWILEHPNARLIIIDTLQKIRGKQKGNSNNVYADDYLVISSLKSIADKYNIAIIVVHHQRKMTSDDIFDTVSGSLGLTGGADSTFVLAKEKRGKSEAMLHIVGRDIEEQEFALTFDKYTSSWHLLGNAEEHRKSNERLEIINLLKSSETSMSPKDISICLSKAPNNISFLLYQMVRAGEIKQIERGKYTIDKPNNTNIDINTNNANIAKNTNNYGLSLYEY